MQTMPFLSQAVKLTLSSHTEMPVFIAYFGKLAASLLLVPSSCGMNKDTYFMSSSYAAEIAYAF